MTNMMEFPDTFDKFVKEYGIIDKEEKYTNGVELIPVFRVEQWLEHIRAEIYLLHHHPKLDFIKNDEVVDMALEVIDKYRE